MTKWAKANCRTARIVSNNHSNHHDNNKQLTKQRLTGEVLQALAGVAPLAAVALAVVAAGAGVAQVDLRLAVVAREARGAAAAQAVDGVDGPEQHRVRRDERRRAVELEHRHALHVVLARLAQANVVVERQHLAGTRNGTGEGGSAVGSFN